MSEYTANEAKSAGDEPASMNVATCTICRHPADRYRFDIRCRQNPAHFADLNTGIFDDHSMKN